MSVQDETAASNAEEHSTNDPPKETTDFEASLGSLLEGATTLLSSLKTAFTEHKDELTIVAKIGKLTLKRAEVENTRDKALSALGLRAYELIQTSALQAPELDAEFKAVDTLEQTLSKLKEDAAALEQELDDAEIAANERLAQEETDSAEDSL